MAVIHQPRWSVFQQFDKLLLLQKGGHQIYYGSTEKSTVTFKLKNKKQKSFFHLLKSFTA